MEISTKEKFHTTPKEEIMIYFANVKNEIYRYLSNHFSKESIYQILGETERELEELVPDLPFGTGKESVYVRLVIYVGIAVALYLGIIAVSKNKTLAKSAAITLLTRYVGLTPPNSGKLYGAWMFYRLLEKRLSKKN